MFDDVLSSIEVFRQESQERLDLNAEQLCEYGIKALDDPLIKILPNDLVVIGADSGVGKSELALKIAQYNARKGKRVLLYYLEGGHIEAMRRMKWRDICEEYYKNHFHEGIEMTYGKWVTNSMNLRKEKQSVLMSIESRVYEKYKELYENSLYIYPISHSFSIDVLLSSLIDFHKMEYDAVGNIINKFDLDLIVIDHLQYFSLAEGETEIQSITRILKEVKQISDQYKIPVVLISHLRKKAKDRGLPGQEDFYGSSNIPKIASVAITLAPNYGVENLKDGVFPTYIRIVKSRVGIPPSIALKVNFDIHIREYQKDYEIYRLDNDGHIGKAIFDGELPKWARSA